MATRRRREDDELFGPPAGEDISDDADVDAQVGDAGAEEADSDLGLGEMGADTVPEPEPVPEPAGDLDTAPVDLQPGERPDALSEFAAAGALPAEPLFADEPPEEESGAGKPLWTRVPGRRSLTNRRRGALILVVLVVLAAIAAIIVGTQSTSPPPAGGSAEVTSGSIRSTVNLHGVVVRQNTQNVNAPVTGTVSDIAVRPGDAVTEGDQVATVTLLPLPTPSPTPTGTSPSPTAAPSPITETVTAPIGGTVGQLSVTRGQIVVNGQRLLTVIPAQYDVIASVPQDQLYRFYTPPLSIQAVIAHQDQPIDCAFTSIGANLPTSGATNVLQEEVDLRCTLPVGTSVFPGVPANVVAVTAEVDDALTLPVSAVQHKDNGASGVVYVLEKGKAPQKTNVTLGISDGKRIQIVSGLFAGQRVRDPAVSGTPTP
jgi:multidrug efflux pump subunit AcrA (membrane-fusion protein)